jgi:hypothetical protein
MSSTSSQESHDSQELYATKGGERRGWLRDMDEGEAAKRGARVNGESLRFALRRGNRPGGRPVFTPRCPR